MTWNNTFTNLFERCEAKYRGGDTNFEGYYSDEDLDFLNSIGCKKREFFDFIEDYCDDGVPTPTTALLVASVRRDYFLVMQDGNPSDEEITRNELPTFGDELDGIHYLPRILTKARAKLTGELDPDIMFGCGGDRKFLRENGDIHPADFLRHVWDAGNDDQAVADFVKSQRG